jgi:hypothetical protein
MALVHEPSSDFHLELKRSSEAVRPRFAEERNPLTAQIMNDLVDDRGRSGFGPAELRWRTLFQREARSNDQHEQTQHSARDGSHGEPVEL